MLPTLRPSACRWLLLAALPLFALPASGQGSGPGDPASGGSAFGRALDRLFIPGFGRIFALGAGYGQPHIVVRQDNLPVGRQNIVVFVAAGCEQCMGAVEDARRYAGTNLEVLDVTGNSYAADTYRRLGLPGLPATVAGSQILVGRDPNLVQSVLGGAGMQAAPLPP
jgi:hypothetical protein